MQLKLTPEQIKPAIAEADDVYIWVDDLFCELGAYVRVDKEHLLSVLEDEGKKGWRLHYTVILKGADIWIGGGG